MLIFKLCNNFEHSNICLHISECQTQVPALAHVGPRKCVRTITVWILQKYNLNSDSATLSLNRDTALKLRVHSCELSTSELYRDWLNEKQSIRIFLCNEQLYDGKKIYVLGFRPSLPNILKKRLVLLRHCTWFISMSSISDWVLCFGRNKCSILKGYFQPKVSTSHKISFFTLFYFHPVEINEPFKIKSDLLKQLS